MLPFVELVRWEGGGKMVVVFKWKNGGSYSCNEEQIDLQGGNLVETIKAWKEEEGATITLYGKKMSISEIASVEILFDKKIVDRQIVDM